jgi:ribosomal-protein-alanine acetyltransferase
MSLERHSASAGHWTEKQYHAVFGSENPARLLLVAEAVRPAASHRKSHKPSGILGFLIAQHLPPEWELENLVVAADSRRQGIGKRLLSTLLAAARKTSSTAVFLEVRDSNQAARTLYEKSGFEQTGRRHGYYASPSEDAILYRNTLD